MWLLLGCYLYIGDLYLWFRRWFRKALTAQISDGHIDTVTYRSG